MKNLINTNAKFNTTMADELEFGFDLDNVDYIEDSYVIIDVNGNIFETYDEDEAVRMYGEYYTKGEPTIIAIPWYVQMSEFKQLCIITTLQELFGEENLVDDGVMIYAKAPDDKAFVEDANYPYVIYAMDEPLVDSFIKQQNANGCCMGRIYRIDLYDRTFDEHFRYYTVPVSLTEKGDFEFHR